MKPNGRLSETLLVSTFLAITGGFLDAYTYLYRGGVFANGQTGNLVLLGIRAAERDWKGASYYVPPILAFLSGVLVSELIRIYVGDVRMIKWRHVILAAEITILTAAVFAPRGTADRQVNVAISFVCALQTQSFRSLRGKPYISVMCTGNLRSAAEELSKFGQYRDKIHLRNAGDYLVIVLFFIVGALAGSMMTTAYGGAGLWMAIALLMAVFIILLLKTPILALCERRERSR